MGSISENFRQMTAEAADKSASTSQRIGLRLRHIDPLALRPPISRHRKILLCSPRYPRGCMVEVEKWLS
jgi:hypothetical protein